MSGYFKGTSGSLLGHRMLNAAALASLVGSIVVLVLFATDSRELLGVSVWEKPLKFLISATFYATTFSWLYTFVEKGKGLASKMGNVIALMLIVELVVIVGMASVGSTSHFNVSTPFNIAIWSLMATAISIVWLATFSLSTGLWNSQIMSADLRLAVRWSIGLGLAGMGIAFTMTPHSHNRFYRKTGLVLLVPTPWGQRTGDQVCHSSAGPLKREISEFPTF